MSLNPIVKNVDHAIAEVSRQPEGVTPIADEPSFVYRGAQVAARDEFEYEKRAPEQGGKT
jgi:hypothetical protein